MKPIKLGIQIANKADGLLPGQGRKVRFLDHILQAGGSRWQQYQMVDPNFDTLVNMPMRRGGHVIMDRIAYHPIPQDAEFFLVKLEEDGTYQIEFREEARWTCQK